MATIRKRNDRYHVQIRKNGYSSLTKTFTSLTVARKWAAGVEADMERRLHVTPPDNTTVGDLLEKYDREVLPTHKGQQAEWYRLRNFERYFGAMRLTDLTPKEIAKYRNIRLKVVTPASLKRELKILSRILTIAKSRQGTDKTIRGR